MGNKAKQNTNKTNRGVNVHSVVYASVECDSLRLWSSVVGASNSLSLQRNYWAHVRAAQLGNRERKAH